MRAYKLEPWSLVLGLLLMFVGAELLFLPDEWIITSSNIDTFNVLGAGLIGWVNLLAGGLVSASVIFANNRRFAFTVGATVCAFWCWTYLYPAVNGGTSNAVVSLLWAFVMARMIAEARQRPPIYRPEHLLYLPGLIREGVSIQSGICIRCSNHIEYIFWPESDRPVGMCGEHKESVQTDYKKL